MSVLKEKKKVHSNECVTSRYYLIPIHETAVNNNAKLVTRDPVTGNLVLRKCVTVRETAVERTRVRPEYLTGTFSNRDPYSDCAEIATAVRVYEYASERISILG